MKGSKSALLDTVGAEPMAPGIGGVVSNPEATAPVTKSRPSSFARLEYSWYPVVCFPIIFSGVHFSSGTLPQKRGEKGTTGGPRSC